MNSQHFRMTAGEDRTLSLVARNRSQAIVVITGATIQFRLAKRVGDSPLVTKSGTITDAANGAYTVALAAADTEDLHGEYVYRVYFTISGSVSVYTGGRIMFDEGVPST